MSFEEIIEGVSAVAKNELTRCHGLPTGMSVYLYEAIDKLRTHPDALPNEPLTLEELREMDGQPVWCQPDEGVGCWVLVTVRASKVVVRDQYGMTGDVEVWMKRGERYYRRPPKEG